MYVIYTSGTTGFPKGIPITYSNLSCLLASTELFFDFNDKDVWTLFHSLAFDFSVWEWCGAFNYGGSLIIVPYSLSRDAEKFYQLVKEKQVTILNQTPSAFYQFMDVDKVQQKELCLRHVIFGGEKLDYPLLSDWFNRHKENSPYLTNMYGITEITIHATFFPIKKDLINSKDSFIGKPLPHLKGYILDNEQQLIPFGCIGELYLSGPSITSGYLNKSEETQQRFINNPFSKDTYFKRMYVTGDLVKELPSGELIYLGRKDMQVSLKGYRIELSEIEYQLNLHEKIKKSVVTLNKNNPLSYELEAYVLLQVNQFMTQFELRQHLKKTLPSYMIPSIIYLVIEIPSDN